MQLRPLKLSCLYAKHMHLQSTDSFCHGCWQTVRSSNGCTDQGYLLGEAADWAAAWAAGLVAGLQPGLLLQRTWQPAAMHTHC
jgi:hypothetical protein